MQRKRGRPVSVDYSEVNELLKSSMTLTAIAKIVGCSVSTVHRFSKRPASERRKLAK